MASEIAPRTYWARKKRPASRRALRDALVTGDARGSFQPDGNGRRRPESLYGAVKAWDYLRRQGVVVARCTVDGVMRARGWRGSTRARTTRTTVPDPGAPRSPDPVKRNFKARQPGQLHVADFTHVPPDGGGFAYTAFTFGPARRDNLCLAGPTGSVGTVGDAYDNALAETTIGLYKCECVRDGSPSRDGPPRTLADVEKIDQPAGKSWYNTGRLTEPPRRTSPGSKPRQRTGQPRASPAARAAGLDTGPSRGPPPGQGPGQGNPPRRHARLRPPAPCQARLAQPATPRRRPAEPENQVKYAKSRHKTSLITQKPKCAPILVWSIDQLLARVTELESL